MAILDAVIPHLVHLVARAADDDTNDGDRPGNKSPEQFASQGRYNYAPSFAAAVIFLILFSAVLAANVVQFIWHRAWFWWVMIFAVSLEFVGYLTRAMSIKDLDSRGLFIIQTVVILVAPAVMAAACYMAFGRIVLWVVPPRFQTARHLWVPARRITPVFVGSDVFSFFVQVIGGAMVAAANTAASANRGKDVVLIGLALQLAAFGFFVVASLRLNVLLRRGMRDVALPKERNWELFLTAVNVANVLILIRTILRFVEFALGATNYLIDHEWFFYAFDSAPMLLVAVLFVVIHPGHYLPYLGIRRREQQFSRNADAGPFANLAKGRMNVQLT
ncbi:Protein RTA1 [Cladophialophora carrionii]|uniref:Protein RTA1 n=1 Tax=Cladophialophora carrionii TaxID=86049 RepID=A0A1C1D287_9EURO|nr:Protein RTA1 [Cladophialophora carrionii]